jgi:NAD-dependent SIR2 family protein deacetylase
MWRQHDAMSLATPRAFAADPSTVWQFYHMRRETCAPRSPCGRWGWSWRRARKAQPNAAHRALAHFSVPARRPPGTTFTLITQNVDGLSARALAGVRASLPSDAEALLEMHGRLFDVTCTARGCAHSVFDPSSPVCAALAGTEALDVGAPRIALEDLPRCARCGALARPGVVWFGERPLYLDTIDALVAAAELCIVVGTSSTVRFLPGTAQRALMRHRCTLRRATRRRSRRAAGRSRCSTSSGARATRMRTFCSLGRARRRCPRRWGCRRGCDASAPVMRGGNKQAYARDLHARGWYHVGLTNGQWGHRPKRHARTAYNFVKYICIMTTWSQGLE